MRHRGAQGSGKRAIANRIGVAALLMMMLTGPAMAQGGKDWPTAAPKDFGFHPEKLDALDADLASGKYGLVDSMLVLRCGTNVYDKTYKHDYGQTYGERGKKEGPLNHDLTGPYNYFSTDFHPYYHGTDMHTMQSISKTVTSVTLGIAKTHDDFPVSLDTPILKYFDSHHVKNLDDRKKRITIRDLLTMSAGIEWHEDVPYDDPRNSADLMEASHDWVQYVMDQPMASEPGKTFVYSSGATVLLAHVFKKVTGKNVDDYAEEHLFRPLGIRHYWKHTPTGLPDTEGGLYLSTHDLAKIGQLYLKGGMWEGKELVSSYWVKDSVSAHLPAEDKFKYGYYWWLSSFGTAPDDVAWAARGFGGQLMYVVPEYDMVAVFTGWDILSTEEQHPHDLLERTLDSANRFYGCTE
ncbi:MAG TPA: serine hydrolase [Candidatus Methylomirabilis sp.]|nr:serine hydrolase [Candidatus Methylomirabilis sp.]